eukprot:3404655-Pyramimonas_sp.AAC.1
MAAIFARGVPTRARRRHWSAPARAAGGAPSLARAAGKERRNGCGCALGASPLGLGVEPIAGCRRFDAPLLGPQTKLPTGRDPRE